MPWDEAAAQEAVAEFTDALTDLIDESQSGEVSGTEALKTLQAIWQASYMTSGHKRLARVFLKALIE